MFSVRNMHPEIRDAHPKHQKLPAPPASRPKGQMCCVHERMYCGAASAPLETSHATVFLLLQRFGCLAYVCLTRLFFPSCVKFSDIQLVCLMSIFYDWITLGAAQNFVIQSQSLSPARRTTPGITIAETGGFKRAAAAQRSLGWIDSVTSPI